ncbi:hypothetical protein BGZ98_001399 [Dissophora globulifera]|nr:hypothetical protein BGZ98_001399 [Dissophora globulifera]
MSTATGAQETAAATTGPVGGHLTKKQRKEQFEALSTLQTQLDVSVSLARNKVTSWLNVDAFSDDEDNSNNSSGFAAATVVKPRQPGLGLGAKFISHRDQMRHVPTTAFESKLKRQLTGGIVQGEIQRAEAADRNALPDKYQEHKLMMAARRKELQEQAEDEEDSRTRNIGSAAGAKAGTANIPPTSVHGSHKHHTKAALPSPSTARSTGPSHNGGVQGKKKETKYQAAVHPAALKAGLPEQHQQQDAADKTTSGPGSSASKKKRPTDFFSTYMDERANKIAKKKQKNSAKADPDDE